MGLPKLQILPGEIQGGYFLNEVNSPLTFFSTLETVVGNISEPGEHVLLPLEEMEIGMVTEVRTSEEAEQECIEDNVGAFEDCESVEKEAETESCSQDNRLYSECEDSVYVSSVLEEIVDSGNSYENYDINCNLLEDLTQNADQNFNSNEIDISEIISDVDNDDFVMSWLSNLNGTTTINDADLGMPDVGAASNDRIPAKEELRSFILTRKTKTTNLVNDQDDSNQKHNLRSRTGNITSIPKMYDDCDSSELQRLRKRQERNRIAAQKCRQKRTKLVDELSEESEMLKKQNEELTSEVRDLLKELRMLQNVLLDHDLHSMNSRCHEQLSANMFSPELTKLTNLL